MGEPGSGTQLCSEKGSCLWQDPGPESATSPYSFLPGTKTFWSPKSTPAGYSEGENSVCCEEPVPSQLKAKNGLQ
jgi:hypothetical protein